MMRILKKFFILNNADKNKIFLLKLFQKQQITVKIELADFLLNEILLTESDNSIVIEKTVSQSLSSICDQIQKSDNLSSKKNVSLKNAEILT